MNVIIVSLLALLGGMAIFMVGVKQMSEGLEKTVSKGMQKLLSKISNNKFVGLGIGTLITAVVHSSAATTVMSIGFVNAGIMTLEQATAIILGANIGTTLTGVFAVLSTFNISIYFSILAIIGVFTQMLSQKDIGQKVGQILTGLGLIFIGLSSMGTAFAKPEMNEAMQTIFSIISNPFLLLLISLVITGLVQSSTAIVGVVIVLAGTQAIPLESALFVILGADVGTCITAILASFGTNINAKRTAMIQLLFNVFGAVLFFVILILFKGPIMDFLIFLTPVTSFQVAIFHMSFNLITAIIAIPFITPFCKLVRWLVKEKNVKETHLRTLYLDERLLITPPLALSYAQKEVVRMLKIAKDNIHTSLDAILKQDYSQFEVVKKNEETINYLNVTIAQFLISVSSKPMSLDAELVIGKLHHIINDIERIGDHAKNFMDSALGIRDDNITFSEKGQEELSNIINNLYQMFEDSEDIFENRNLNKLNEISKEENNIDILRVQLESNHIQRLKEGTCSIESGHYFYKLSSDIERVADHLTNIAYSVVSVVGDEV
ncbi:MAG: Na/Pi cotransporter family protein [Bacillales bacterium]|jgi:phosphate:Na+ symporter|nr:Na/Pi cotransporter family protein [Bacillales bacterium]